MYPTKLLLADPVQITFSKPHTFKRRSELCTNSSLCIYEIEYLTRPRGDVWIKLMKRKRMSSIFLKIILLKWSEDLQRKHVHVKGIPRRTFQISTEILANTCRNLIFLRGDALWVKLATQTQNITLIRQIICLSWPSVKIAFVTLCSPWTITNIYGGFEILNTPIAQCKRNLYCNSPCTCPWVTVTVLNGRTSHAIP